MATTTNEKAVALKDLVAAHQKSKTKVDELSRKIDELTAVGGEPNKIESISVNGTAQAITDKTVDLTIITEEQVNTAINAKVSSTYKAGGSVAFASLPELTEANLGLVVNVTDKFTTTDSFVEGAGGKHPAGTNVAVVKVGEEYKYDVLAGFVDLSGYVEKDGSKVLSTNDYTNEEKAKLAGIEFATDEEVAAALAGIYGE